MAVSQQSPYMQPSDIPPEDFPPARYPPSSGLPPDAVQSLAFGGNYPSPAMAAGAGGAGTAPAPSPSDQMGMATSPGPMAGQGAALPTGPGSMAGPGMAGAPASPLSAGSPTPDPMTAVKDQANQLIQGLQMFAQAYPMAADELQ